MVKKWEYKIAAPSREAVEAAKAKADPHLYFSPWRQATELEEEARLNELGDEGWELVAYKLRDRESKAIFKREKSSL